MNLQEHIHFLFYLKQICRQQPMARVSKLNKSFKGAKANGAFFFGDDLPIDEYVKKYATAIGDWKEGDEYSGEPLSLNYILSTRMQCNTADGVRG